ncbi:MAG: hypothetical protein JXR70_05015 [Spirochaetales bacterium]|nr:hypothetical protein [Spirochaetales bacterium]
MNSNTESFLNLRFFDDLSAKRTFVHSIHPLFSLIVACLYLFSVISVEKYALSRLFPLVLYPFIIIPLAEIPFLKLLKRTVYVLPLVIGIGIFNPLFDNQEMLIAQGISINAGWISFAVLVIKAELAVLGALILFATTGIVNIAYALRLLRVPRFFVLQLLLTYRYITLMNLETARLLNAYALRAPDQKGIAMKAWGPLAGQLLIRTFDAATHVYHAMKLRGFDGEYRSGRRFSVSFKDFAYAISWLGFFILVYFFDISGFLGSLFTGG